MIAKMNSQIAEGRKGDTGIQNRRSISWNSKLRSTKLKAKAEPFASAQKSLQDETLFHCLPNEQSGKLASKQANAGFTPSASWDELETELDGRTKAARNDLNEPTSTGWGDPKAELEKRMNGSVKHLNTPRSALWDELEAEIERRMSGLLKDINVPRFIPTDEKEKPFSSKKGESHSSVMEAPRTDCESPRCSLVAMKGQKTCQLTVVKVDTKTPNSEKRPPLDKTRNKLPMGGSFWEKLWMKKMKKIDSKSTMSTSSSSEIATSTSFDSKSSTKGFWRSRSSNSIKSANADKKGINPTTEIGTSSGKTKRPSRKPATNYTSPSKEESWLQQTIKNRDQTWLKQARIAIEEAKKNAKSSEPFDKRSSSITSGSETSEGSGTSSDSESDCSVNEYMYFRTDTRATNYSYMARNIVVDGDGIDILLRCLTCNEIMMETEPDMSSVDPRGMVVGGMCARKLWVAKAKYVSYRILS
jgi:hypothetical protein